MVVLTGANKPISIKKDVYYEICRLLKEHHYESGGIIGMKNDEVVKFQFDSFGSKKLFEYYPNTDFFEKIINENWSKNGILFAGIVHSHLHNGNISQQDILYSRRIIEANMSIAELLMGIVDLSKQNDLIRWYLVTRHSVSECKKVLL